MIVWVVPVVPVGVYMTEHEAVPIVPAASAQGEVTNTPVPLVVKSTYPRGVNEVPTPEESVTVAVHVVAVPVLTDAGMHATDVVVGRTTIVRFAVVPEPA